MVADYLVKLFGPGIPLQVLSDEVAAQIDNLNSN